MKKSDTLQLSKRLIYRFLYVCLFLSSFTATYSQNGVIKGKITDKNNNEPLIGASVVIKGTGVGAASDLDGNFTITNVKPGKYIIRASFISYRTDSITGVAVEAGKETILDIKLSSADISLREVEVVARANRESENILLMEQKQSLIATQAVGAKEMSRKGISNAEAAVAQVSGVSKQEGVKNVVVRGLGDRYNFTTLNGFPIPSEDPEYKNISLDFFGSDVIQNVSVKKAFSGNNYSDVGGAVIDISSKELVGDKELGLNLSAGLNTQQTINNSFLKMDGVNYWGSSNNVQPGKSYKTSYNYGNSLDPQSINLPINNSYGFAGGKRFRLGENQNPLSFYIVGNYSTDYSNTVKEKILKSTNGGVIYNNFQNGHNSSQNISQLLLGNLNFSLNKKHTFDYNFMLVHNNSQYVGEYSGFLDAFVSSVQLPEYENQGYVRWQQSNDNLLIVNQLLSKLTLSEKLKLDAGISYNVVNGSEPDRRVNKLVRINETEYQPLAGDGAHIRNFNKLVENDMNTKINLSYELPKKFKDDASSVNIGYNGRYITDEFEGTEYSMVITTLNSTQTLENLSLNKWFNQSNYDSKLFVGNARFSTYQVDKSINSGYISVDYQFSQKFTANLGLRADAVHLAVDYNVQGGYNGDGTETLTPFYLLPSLNLKYSLNDKNALRLGLSKTYTLPQSKEISPYQYIGNSFSSQGNQNIKPSDNYNADLKWDYYLTPSELISLTGFYKYIKMPIARAYEANGAGYFTYDNISDNAHRLPEWKLKSRKIFQPS
ncbi:MAG: TonB-dependent receptor [Paludibacteraceae bacterium]